MMRGPFPWLFAVALLLTGRVASAQSPLTLNDVLTRVRAQAPRIVAARLALEESRARLVGASLKLPSNPEVDLAFGSRNGPGGRSLDVDAGVTQALGQSGHRDARIAGATAAIDQQTAVLAETIRIVVAEATSAFYRAVYADERLRLLNSAASRADSVLQATDRRYRAGDVAILDVNLSRIALGRVHADQEAAKAAKATAASELTLLLQLVTEPVLDGSLRPTNVGDVDRLIETALLRPEIAELEAAVREADAEVRLGSTYSKPEYGLSFRYAREDQSNVFLGGVTFTIPSANKGQELIAAGSARASRLRSELQAARARVQNEVRAAVAVHNRRLEAVQVLERESLPGLDENDALATRSFEVGQLGLPELLLVRRELLEARFQYLEARLEAALARIDLESKAGLLR